MPEVITFIGWHDSGKTTLLSKVIKRLKGRGWKVCVIKSSSHKGIEFDTPNTDTGRFRDAGAEAIALAAPDQLVIMKPNDRMPLRALAQRFFPFADIVLGEGFKEASGVDKVEVAIRRPPSLYREVSGVTAVVTQEDVPGTKVFRPDEDFELADFIENRYILKDHDKPSAHLLVNGRPIPLKFFVQQAISGAVSGLVNSLKGTKGAETIEIFVRLPKGSV